jgi:hypothetical protein
MDLDSLIGIDQVHEEGGKDLDNQKLHYPLLASIGKILRLLPVRELIWFLAVAKGPEVMHFLLVRDHDRIDFFVFHYILNYQGNTFYLS